MHLTRNACQILYKRNSMNNEKSECRILLGILFSILIFKRLTLASWKQEFKILLITKFMNKINKSRKIKNMADN